MSPTALPDANRASARASCSARSPRWTESQSFFGHCSKEVIRDLDKPCRRGCVLLILNKSHDDMTELVASVQRRQKAGWGKRDMGLHRRTQDEGGRLTSEIPDPDELPSITPSIGNSELVGAEMEGCSLPADRGLHLDQLFASIRFEAGNIVAVSVAVLLRRPARPAGKIRSANRTR